jgi:hypothetical protein
VHCTISHGWSIFRHAYESLARTGTAVPGSGKLVYVYGFADDGYLFETQIIAIIATEAPKSPSSILLPSTSTLHILIGVYMAGQESRRLSDLVCKLVTAANASDEAAGTEVKVLLTT